MKIKPRDWLVFILLALLCFGLWYKLEYPRFAFVNLPINKQQALAESENYLKAKNIDTKSYRRAIVFDSDEKFNRYFQHAAGLKAQEAFIKQHNFDLFRWVVRVFKESQKEEFLIYVSPRSGSIIRFMHLIEDIEPRTDLGRDLARQKAQAFLRQAFGTDLEQYDFHEEKIKRYENRVEYVFSWEKKEVYIPWKEGQGGGKLLCEVTVSGNEIREFYINKFDSPERFLRYVEKQFILGEYLYSIFYILLFILLGWSVNIVLKKRQDVIPRLTKRWFYYVAGFLMLVNTADLFNNLQYIFMAYPTSARWGSFFGLSVTRWLFNTGFLIIGFIMPGIAGEILCNEVFLDGRQRSFLPYIKSNFFTRALSRSVLLGYLIWIIMLGLQAVIFYNGQKFLGVWREWYTMTYFSSAYLPWLSAFVIGISASLSEEITFRLFGISLAKRYLRNWFLAILATALIWGMGHTTYAIFPVWFRVIEVGLIGIFYGFVFLRFGIIPLIVAHYLFDVFWCSAAYLLGRSSGYLFYTCAGLLVLPLFLAIGAYFLNRNQQERPVRQILDKTQKYNLGVLVAFVSARKLQGYSADSLQKELLANNWDNLLVNLALQEVFDQHR